MVKISLLLLALVLFPLGALGEEVVLKFDKIDPSTQEKIQTYYYSYMSLMSLGPIEERPMKAKADPEPGGLILLGPSYRCLRVTFWAVESSGKCLVESILVGRGGTMTVNSSWYIPPYKISGAAKVSGSPFRTDEIQWVDPRTFDLIDHNDYYDRLKHSNVKGPRIIRLMEKEEGVFVVTAVSMGTP